MLNVSLKLLSGESDVNTGLTSTRQFGMHSHQLSTPAGRVRNPGLHCEACTRLTPDTQVLTILQSPPQHAAQGACTFYG